MPTIAIIGAGFSGISAASYLAQAGHDVHVFEKHAIAGGRARQYSTENGYVFDMGPSWYWMPEVFENFFNDFDVKVSDLYSLKLLEPAFEVIFEDEKLKIPTNFDELCSLFEAIEKDAGKKLKRFMFEAGYKYEVAMQMLVTMPGISIKEFLDPEFRNLKFLKGLLHLDIFTSLSTHVRKYFKNPKLIALMEFPVLFLGAKPSKIPALYSLMNYAGLKLGTWYPDGGFGKVVESMVSVAQKNGAKFYFNSDVSSIEVNHNYAKGIVVNGSTFNCDAVVAAADYAYVEDKLLQPEHRNYSNSYWNKKTFAPSCLIYFLGVKKKLASLNHHTLFFENDFALHADEIYTRPSWPTKPLFYVCAPSKSDEHVAPEGHENLFLLMPLAPGLEDTNEMREKYFNEMMMRLQKHTGETITSYLDYKKSYCVNNFIEDYNAYKGNAYGLANTLTQTAILKPGIRNKKVSNLLYTGQLTVPGPGVPPSIISGKLVANQLINQLKKHQHESVI